ncbi:short-chain dehydrogenase [Flavisolibacter sp. BT320]|nr:short-chain dehydrogenase [Flavisolibacter longurius]
MTIEDIQKFLDTKTSAGNAYVKITFKKRDAVCGLFVKEHKDYGDLKAKNFWRIVPKSQFDAYRQTKNIGLAKIFSGSDFTRLVVSKDPVA